MEAQDNPIAAKSCQVEGNEHQNGHLKYKPNLRLTLNLSSVYHLLSVPGKGQFPPLCQLLWKPEMP